MQILYSKRVDDSITDQQVMSNYTKSVDQFFEAYLFNLYLIELISKMALEDAKIRKAKHLPSDYDRSFVPKLYTNLLIQSLVQNTSLQKEYKRLQFAQKVDSDLIKKLYSTFAKEQDYVDYISKADSDRNDHLQILLSLYRLIRKHELFVEMVDNQYRIWSDDSSLVIGAIKKSLKLLPTVGSFYKGYLPDEETVDEFGRVLLSYVMEHDDELEEIIRPTLKNWDMNRVAILDMVFLKLATTEFIYFAQIPSKVTINEYVELAKRYSTEKSREFINGVVDQILQNLKKQKRITKEGRGLDN